MNYLSPERLENPESIESSIYTILNSGSRANGSVGMHLDLPRLGRTLEAAHLQPVTCTLYPRGKGGEGGYICEVSPQLGCVVGCDFCRCGQPRANLMPVEVVEQIRLLQTAAIHHGISLEEANKISFADGGELLLNPRCMEIIRAVTNHLPAPVKVSTVLPDSALARRNLAELMKFTHIYVHGVTLQVSLYSTDENIRQMSAAVQLYSFDSIRELGREWTNNHPQRRKITLTFTLTSESRVDPHEITNVLSPELFKIRLHPHKENGSGFERLAPSACLKLEREFHDAGYDDTYLDEYDDADADQLVDFGTASLVWNVL